MKVTAEAIFELMLFCQHIHKAMNYGLKLGLLYLFEAVIWLTAANFPPSGSSWSVPYQDLLPAWAKTSQLEKFYFFRKL